MADFKRVVIPFQIFMNECFCQNMPQIFAKLLSKIYNNSMEL